MGRQKRVIDDGDSDSDNISEDDNFDYDNNDRDLNEERALFQNPYKRKRRTKESELYGIFGEDSDKDDEDARKRKRKNDWTRAPAFVTGEKEKWIDPDQDITMGTAEVTEKLAVGEESEGDDGENDGSGDEGAEGDDSDKSVSSRPPSPRVREEEVDEDEFYEQPRTGLGRGKRGIGSSTTPSFASAVIDTGRGAKPDLGSKGDIGSLRNLSFTKASSPKEQFTPEPTRDVTPSTLNESTVQRSMRDESPVGILPSTFGRRSFVRNAPPVSKNVQLTTAERAHFSGLSASIGSKLMAKMGWRAGMGLGTEGEGIINPIESKLRPQRAGIAFKGFKERTEQSKQEAKRKGQEVSSDEDDARTKNSKKHIEKQKKRSDVWKKTKEAKTKIEHKTYEQILAEAGVEVPAPGIGPIIDATGAVPREVSSLSDISFNSWAPSNDPNRIPEVRHNIRLIADEAKADLDALAREARLLEHQKKQNLNEDTRLRKQVEVEAELIARLQQVEIMANEINIKAKELATLNEVYLEPFTPLFSNLIHQFDREFDRFGLDEIVVGAITPVVRRMVISWDPLADPTMFVDTFRHWKKALKVGNHEEIKPKNEVSLYGGTATVVGQVIESQKLMTPFESLLWNVWLPKVRTALNNSWAAEEPDPAVRFYEIWSTFLPTFIRDNIMDQLIVPKVHKAVTDWSPKKFIPLQRIVFPWLPYAGLRLEDLLGDAKRKVKSVLRGWNVGDKMLDLLPWKDIFDVGDWDAMLLKYIIPKLGATLRNDFRINPRQQNMEPLHTVLAWFNLLRPSIFTQLLESEFFPKWLDVLHIWLIQPNVSFEEVAQWYTFWKGTLPDDIKKLKGVEKGFTRGLQLMNDAIELGPDAPTKLKKVDWKKEVEVARVKSATLSSKEVKAKSGTMTASRAQEITFRSIVEDYAAAQDLMLIPLGKVHEVSRMPLFRVSETANGRGGLVVYILDDVVWAPRKAEGEKGAVEKEDFAALSLEDMIKRALGH